MPTETPFPGRSPSGPAGYLDRIRAKALRIGMESLAADRSVASLAHLAEQAAKYAEVHGGLAQDEARMLAQAGRQPPIACRKGCSHCCYTRLAATVPEVLYLAERIVIEFDAERIARLRARLAAHRARLEANAPRGDIREPSPCPLLEDDSCSVHPARPLICRAFNSVDVGACATARANWREPARIPGVARQVLGTGAVQEGLLASLRQSGLRDEMVEMPTALEVVLEDERAGDRWLAGEDVFIGPRRLAEYFNGPSGESLAAKRDDRVEP